MAMKYWSKSELSQYNSAKNPWFNIYENGKIDIGFENEKMDRLSLQDKGMLLLVKEWLIQNKNLSKSEKMEIIQILGEQN